MSSKLTGILPVLPTPFNEEGEIDLEAMESVAQFCVDAGANALVFPGVASEYDHLTLEERLSLLEVVCRVARGKIPVVSGGGQGDPATVGSKILKAQELGAAVAMVLIPSQFADDEEGGMKFMLSVIEHAPGVEIILQNAPAPIGAGLDAQALARIINASPAIRYVKEEALPSGPRISDLKAAAPKHLIGVIGGGGARYLIDEMNRGAIAAMPAAEITDVHVDMWNAYQRGKIANARDLYMRALPLLVIQMIYRMRLTKYILEKRGVLNNTIVRAPLPEFDSFDEAELSVQLKSLSSLMRVAPAKTAAA